MSRSPLVLLLALSLLGCDSQMHLGATPAGAVVSVPATVSAGASGRVVTITQPGGLGASFQSASSLKAAFGGMLVPVTQNADGSFSFTIPPSATVSQDALGNLSVILIASDQTSEIVSLETGSALIFGTPAMTTNPSPAAIVAGQSVQLMTSSPADASRYQFTWAYSSSGQPPFIPIGAQGKQIRWIPPSPGSYTIQLNAIDTQTQKTLSTTSNGPLVVVSDDSGVLVASNPALARGAATQLSFKAPANFDTSGVSYAWAVGTSLQAPFTPLTGSTSQINWLPTSDGNYYVQLTVTHPNGDVNTFTSPTPLVSVSEGNSVIQSSSSSANVGDAITLKLSVPNPGNGPFAWYQAPANSAAWTAIPGNTSAIQYIATSTGAYNFRVDVPQPDGTIQTLTTNTPILSVIQPTPVITVTPADASVTPGSSVTFTLNAQGITQGNYRFNWYVSTNPSFGFTSLPANNQSNTFTKQYNWSIPATQAPGSYFVRADAISSDGTKTYSFVSSTPIVNITTTPFSAP